MSEEVKRKRGRPPKKKRIIKKKEPLIENIKEEIKEDIIIVPNKSERYLLNQAIKNNKAKILRTLQCNEEKYKKKYEKNCSEDRIKKIKEEIEKLMDKRKNIPRKKVNRKNTPFDNISRVKAMETKKLISEYAKLNNLDRKLVSKKYKSAKAKAYRENLDPWDVLNKQIKKDKNIEAGNINEYISKFVMENLFGDGLVADGLVADGLVADGMKMKKGKLIRSKKGKLSVINKNKNKMRGGCCGCCNSN